MPHNNAESSQHYLIFYPSRIELLIWSRLSSVTQYQSLNRWRDSIWKIFIKRYRIISNFSHTDPYPTFSYIPLNCSTDVVKITHGKTIPNATGLPNYQPHWFITELTSHKKISLSKHLMNCFTDFDNLMSETSIKYFRTILISSCSNSF